jgi:hypothetical protein
MYSIKVNNMFVSRYLSASQKVQLTTVMDYIKMFKTEQEAIQFKDEYCIPKYGIEVGSAEVVTAL